jgi:hypothetical protein
MDAPLLSHLLLLCSFLMLCGGALTPCQASHAAAAAAAASCLQLSTALLARLPTSVTSYTPEQCHALLTSCAALGTPVPDALGNILADGFCLTEDSSLQPEELVKGLLATAALGLLTVPRWGWWCMQLASSKWQRCDRQLLQQLAHVQVRVGYWGCTLYSMVLSAVGGGCWHPSVVLHMVLPSREAAVSCSPISCCDMIMPCCCFDVLMLCAVLCCLDARSSWAQMLLSWRRSCCHTNCGGW